jgi:hypothetical protein
MTDKRATAPNPGSTDAVAHGCTCPVIDNNHGKGVPSKDGPLFWITEGCPVHSPKGPTNAI